MTNLRNLALAIAALTTLPCATLQAANLSISFDAPVLYAHPGETVTFSGTITNLESVTVDLNGCDINPHGQFSSDCSLFLTNAPPSLASNATSADFDMFTVTVNDPFTDPIGLQPPGTFTLSGGLEAGNVYDSNTQDVLLLQDFQVFVVPEPGTAASLLLTLPLTAMLRRRRR